MKFVAALFVLSANPASAQVTTGQVPSTPVAIVNALNTTALVTKPNAALSGGTTVSASSAGATISWPVSTSSRSIIIYNTANVNFGSGGSLAMDVTNPSSQEQDFLITIKDTAGNKSQTVFFIPANTTETVAVLESAPTPASYGMGTLPNPYVGVQQVQNFFSGAAANMSSVSLVAFYPAGNFPATNLTISNLRILPTINWTTLMQGSVDAFGQSAVYNWSGKLTDPSQFATRLAAEVAGFTNLLGSTVGTYGGSLALPQQAATGHFYVKKVNGKWWFVDPQGYLFFMNGVDTIASNVQPTMTTGRTNMFQWLPSSTDPLAANYVAANTVLPGNTGTAYSFYTSNLQRKYGTNWMPSFVNTAVQRLKSWGLNAFGAYSFPTVYSTATLPYIRSIALSGSYNTVSTGTDLWGPMPDPFDPAFATAANTTAKNYSQIGLDPYCIGFVVDNEPSWVGFKNSKQIPLALSLGTLAQTASSSPAKQQLIANLTAEYGTIASLNTAWGTTYTQWSDLNAPLSFGSTLTTAMQSDLMNWLQAYATKYYSIVRSALKAACPNTLYFGNSYSANHVINQVAQIAAKYADGFCFNIYNPTPESAGYLAVTSGLDMPIFANEFNFTSTSDGVYGGIWNAPTDAVRSLQYTTYVTAALKDPQFVGCNFFPYVDFPASGELSDGANNMQGLVDVTDTPYSVLITTIQSVAKTMFATRWNS